MVRAYLIRGLLVGVLAGLAATGFAKLVAEPQIAAAERFEQAEARARGLAISSGPVSRDIQDTVGLGTGVVVAGAALGGIYALAFAFVQGRIVHARPRVTAAVLSSAAFTAVFLVPFLKYPATPPAVGNPDTIGHRTAVYFLMILCSTLAAVLAVEVRRLTVNRVGGANAGLLAVAAFVGAVLLAYLALPGIDEVPAAFPATVLWKFRLASVGTQAVLWATIGVAFGALTERGAEASG